MMAFIGSQRLFRCKDPTFNLQIWLAVTTNVMYDLDEVFYSHKRLLKTGVKKIFNLQQGGFE
jgi:hypothetical protein